MDLQLSKASVTSGCEHMLQAKASEEVTAEAEKLRHKKLSSLQNCRLQYAFYLARLVALMRVALQTGFQRSKVRSANY